MNAPDPQGFNPFARYVLSKDFTTSNKLFPRGVDINATNKDGKTCLTLAIEQENISAVEYLLQKGAYPHIEDITGKDACDYAKLANES